MRRVALALALFAPGCAFAPAHDASWRTLDGAFLDPFAVPPGAVRVLVFTTRDCPIANSYAPRLVELAREFEPHAVEWLLVHVDPDVDAQAARAHARDYALPFPILLDGNQDLARACSVTRTPEVAVWTRAGLAYCGRIDDRWRGYGQDGQVATQEDLRMALAAIARGEAPPVARVDGPGCLLPEPAR